MGGVAPHPNPLQRRGESIALKIRMSQFSSEVPFKPDYRIILKYFPDLTEDQKNKFSKLYDLYGDWNSKINVISRKDIDFLYERHVLHSLAIAKVISFKPNTKVLDIGTGGGFPGIPLAILFPEVQFYLVDSIGKKIKVVNEIIQPLHLKNVRAEQTRAEDVKGRYDFVVSRAVADMGVIYGWIKNKFNENKFNDLPNGILFLKGGDLSEELSSHRATAQVFDLKAFFEEDFFESKKVVFLPNK